MQLGGTVCLSVPALPAGREAYIKKCLGGGLFLKPYFLLHCQPSARPLASQSMVVRYLIIFCQCLHRGTQGTMTSPTSQHCWEPGQCRQPHFTGGRTKSPSCCVTYLRSHAKSAGSPGQAAQTSIPGPQHGTPPPIVGQHAPTGTRGGGETAPCSRAGPWAPTTGLCWAASKESPSAGAGGKTPSGDRCFFGRAVPRQCSRWLWLLHTHSRWHSPERPRETWGLEAKGPGELQRSWKKADACLTKARSVDKHQERWAFPLAPESTLSSPALASPDDLQLLLVL